MWTSFWTSTLTAMSLVTTTFGAQVMRTRPCGDPLGDRTAALSVLTNQPCLVPNRARAELARACLAQSRNALGDGRFSDAVEPLNYLGSRADLPAYQDEARDRRHELARLEFESAERHRDATRFAEARRLFEEIPALHQKELPEISARAEAEAARCRLAEAVGMLNGNRPADALAALGELTKRNPPAEVRDAALGLIPEVVSAGAVQRLSRGQLVGPTGVFPLFAQGRELVASRPDLGGRLTKAERDIERQVFGEPVGEASAAPCPTPVYVGAATADAPDRATVRIANDTGHPLKVTYVNNAHQRETKSVPVDGHEALVVEPDTYLLSAHTADGALRPYRGQVELGPGTYEERFSVAE
ncbi:MAG: hypothetical protein HYU66_15525 [Armatimonadetes bacterium]|nr:hypothetical protein [Armatimonadota bacterium]